jgi:hypothetical protein
MSDCIARPECELAFVGSRISTTYNSFHDE